MTAPNPAETRVTRRDTPETEIEFVERMDLYLAGNPSLREEDRGCLIDLARAGARSETAAEKARADKAEAELAASRRTIHDAINALPAPVKDDVVCGKLADHIRHLAADLAAANVERDEAREAHYYANGVADLAMKHRNLAEAECDRFLSQLDAILDRSEEVGEALVEDFCTSYYWDWPSFSRSYIAGGIRERVRAALTAVLPAIRAQERAGVRAETIEACAKVADKEAERTRTAGLCRDDRENRSSATIGENYESEALACDDCAAAIRTLAGEAR